jgi:ActR/RegA family two-component response regulator
MQSMTSGSQRKRVLFVDDEASIRLTLPAILERAGFEVRVAEDITDAIFEINTHPFNILITDLNVGEDGDGFLVASTMRHVQPDCATFILTGYPAFETALQAIQCHVDDYLVKPVDVQSLIDTLRKKLEERQGRLPGVGKQLPQLLHDNTQVVLEAVKRESNRLGTSALLPDLDGYWGKLLATLTEHVRENRDTLTKEGARLAGTYGEAVRQTGFPISTVTSQFRLMGQCIYETLQKMISEMEPAGIIAALRRLNLVENLLLEATLEGFLKGSPPKKHSA